ncbi:MAG: type II secretion system F family protein, partial [Actinomycetota bacterium]
LVLAGILWGLFASLLAAGIVKPTPRLGGRVRPYTIISRTKLGRGVDPPTFIRPSTRKAPGTFGALFGPPLAALVRKLGAVRNAGDDKTLRLKLRQAGYPQVSVEEYRIRQLGAGALATAAGVGVGVMVGVHPGLVLLLGGLGWVSGVARRRARIDRAIEVRRECLRIELYSVNQLLAMHLRTGGGPIQAVRRIVERGSGVVAEDLGEVIRLIAGGVAVSEAFSRLAALTPEPQAARTYELLASGAERGVDLASGLLAFSEDIRDSRREDLRKSATRRRAAMLIPTIALMAPVMLIFVAAPIPFLVWNIR